MIVRAGWFVSCSRWQYDPAAVLLSDLGIYLQPRLFSLSRFVMLVSQPSNKNSSCFMAHTKVLYSEDATQVLGTEAEALLLETSRLSSGRSQGHGTFHVFYQVRWCIYTRLMFPNVPSVLDHAKTWRSKFVRIETTRCTSR